MSLRLPWILWTKIPSHHITAIATNGIATEAYTGTSTGMICKWTQNSFSSKDKRLYPLFVMIPSSCAAALSMCLTISHQKQFLVSSLSSICNISFFLYFIIIFYSSLK